MEVVKINKALSKWMIKNCLVDKKFNSPDKSWADFAGHCLRREYKLGEIKPDEKDSQFYSWPIRNKVDAFGLLKIIVRIPLEKLNSQSNEVNWNLNQVESKLKGMGISASYLSDKFVDLIDMFGSTTPNPLSAYWPMLFPEQIHDLVDPSRLVRLKTWGDLYCEPTMSRQGVKKQALRKELDSVVIDSVWFVILPDGLPVAEGEGWGGDR